MTMKTGVFLLNFGEPENATLEEVVPFLERIFSLNGSLMGPATAEQVAELSRRLAAERAPGLIEEYRSIGGSPLHRQAREQAEALEAELRRRGHDVVGLLGMQFTEPTIAEAVSRARKEELERVVGLPIYPLSGPTTTVAALEELGRQMRLQEWQPQVREITGWHRDPAYVGLRAGVIRKLLAENGLSLRDAGTKLVFSAHGTPIKYLEEGSRYDAYVRDFCALLAAQVGAPEYVIAYQNHTNRPGVRWTQPDVGEVVAQIDARRIVVDPVSFMHEQSETLAELDHELRGQAEERGLEFYRVPIPYKDPAFIGMLADLVEPLLESDSGGDAMRHCLCRSRAGTYCSNTMVSR
jgi:protoporphyrin/coproporphyrin ferrochelatase